MAANAARLPLARTWTNVRELGIPGMASTTAEQAATAACALALAGVVGSVTLPAGLGGAGLGGADTTGLWSSAAVRLGTTAQTLSVTDAAHLVAADPWARQWLRVCPSVNGDRNCGVCPPCQYALTALWLAGASGAELAGFDHPVDPAVIGTLAPELHRDERGRHDCLELIDSLTIVAEGGDGENGNALHGERFLAAALADAWSSYLERVDTWTARLALAGTAAAGHAMSA